MSELLRRQVDRPTFDALAQEILRRGNCLRFKARGQSMYPFIRNGDLLLIEPKSAAELSIGDLVFYRRPGGQYIVHRLVQRDGMATLITKGDSLRHRDRPVPAEDVLGRVAAVERHGRCSRLDGRLNRVMGQAWARISPMCWPLHQVLRPWWRIYRRLAQIRQR